MFSVPSLLRTLTIILIIGTYVYWKIAERKTERIKPKKTRTITCFQLVNLAIPTFTIGLVILQLCGISLFTLNNNNLYISFLGFILVLIGTTTSILARKTLDVNWTHAAEIQIKQEHKLITTGIYKYVRHPIYFGNNLTLIGGELLAHSYIAIIFFGLFIYDYVISKKEEELLIQHFGSRYEQYRKKTKMLIPFVY